MKTVQKIKIGLVIAVSLFMLQAALAFASSDPGFTPEEMEWIRAHPELTVIVNSSPPPISLWGERPEPRPWESGASEPPESPHVGPEGSNRPLIRVSPDQKDKFKGVAADYLDEISAATGIRFIVTRVSDNNFRAIHDAMLKGEADIMPTIIQGREKPPGFMLTRTYIQIPNVIVTRPETPFIEDVKKLESMRVAGVMSIQRKLDSLNLDVRLEHQPVGSGLRGVATGRYDAYLCELSGLSHFLLRHPVNNIKVSGELPLPSEFAMAVMPKNKAFISIFNKAFDAIPKAHKNAIWKKWFHLQYEKKWVSSPLVKTILAGVTLLIIAGLFVIVYYRRKFNRIRTAVAALDPHLLSVHLDDNIVITEVTEAFCRATGFHTADLVGKPLMALGSPEKESETSMDHIWQSLKQGKPWKGDIRILKKDGSDLWARAVVSPLRRKNEEKGGYTVICQDVTEQKHFEKLAVRDELTGLYNRRHFNEVAPALLARALSEKQVFALILLDVDNFKKYNDTYGHPAGDKVLASIGSTLRDIFRRDNDTVFRLGGEEFGAVILVPGQDEARDIGEKILGRIQDLDMIHKHNPPGVVTVSIGIRTVDDKTGPCHMETIYKQADTALYRAKEDGRNRVVIMGKAT